MLTCIMVVEEDEEGAVASARLLLKELAFKNALRWVSNSRCLSVMVAGRGFACSIVIACPNPCPSPCPSAGVPIFHSDKNPRASASPCACACASPVPWCEVGSIERSRTIGVSPGPDADADPGPNPNPGPENDGELYMACKARLRW